MYFKNYLLICTSNICVQHGTIFLTIHKRLSLFVVLQLMLISLLRYIPTPMSVNYYMLTAFYFVCNMYNRNFNLKQDRFLCKCTLNHPNIDYQFSPKQHGRALNKNSNQIADVNINNISHLAKS